MPGMDGTGPSGAGPLTGGGFGPCGTGAGRGAGRGVGAGRGAQRGAGRRFSTDTYRTDAAAPYNDGIDRNADAQKNENRALKQQIDTLTAAVEDLKDNANRK